MRITMIHSKEDYQEALKRFECIFQAPAGTPESKEADALAILIERYEQRNFSAD